MEINRYAILEGTKVVPVGLLKWATYFENIKNRVIKKTNVTKTIEVSTVFLGINHNFLQTTDNVEDGLWFETMIFGGSLDGDTARTSTYEEALKCHERAVNYVKDEL